MRILMAPAGSRGDFQPLLALAVALRAASHEVLLLASPNFVPEAEAFAVPVHALGFDVEVFTREIGISRLRSVYELFKVSRQVMALLDEALPLMQNADLVIGAGAQFVAPTLAERLGVPYVYVGYTPQAFRSRHHAPGMFPFSGLPQVVNRLLWAVFLFSARLVFATPLNRKRQSIGLGSVRDFYEHFFPHRTSLLAADPELAPAPADSSLVHPATGALQLPDYRPIDPAIERFLEAGPAPVYVGFGSMPDRNPEATARLFVEAARLAGVRLLLSSGWARFAGEFGDDVLVIGPTSHTLLFPRVAAIRSPRRRGHDQRGAARRSPPNCHPARVRSISMGALRRRKRAWTSSDFTPPSHRQASRQSHAAGDCQRRLSRTGRCSGGSRACEKRQCRSRGDHRSHCARRLVR